MQRQPLETQTLYAELLERVSAFEAERAIGHLSGTFVTKVIKEREYYYFQYSEPGDRRRQIYIGPKDATLDAVVQRFHEARHDTIGDVTSIERLCALLRAGGAMVTDQASARVLRALSDAGVFRLGGVLVGTHAFVVVGNMLGVTWSGATLRTQDVDVAALTTFSVAIPDGEADVPGALDSLEMGFLPVPALDRRSPSTSFKVRGQGLRVDLVTPERGNEPAPVDLPRFKAAAQPLKFLDYLIADPALAVVINGGGVPVNVPDPSRLALHKLILAGERPAVMHAKRQKDLWQAAQLLEVLTEERPGDLRLAWDALVSSGKGWVKRVEAGLSALEGDSTAIAERVRGISGR